MANQKLALLVGKQSAQGAVATTFFAIPVTKFSHKPKKDTLVPKEFRNSQEAAYTKVGGIEWEEFDLEFYIYHDTAGYIFQALFGAPTNSTPASGVTKGDFKSVDAPPYLTLQFMNGTQSFQAIDCVIDSGTFEWGGKDHLKATAKGMGVRETLISAPTPTYTTSRPIDHWMASVTLGGSAYVRMVSAKYSWSRGRESFYLGGGGKTPNRWLVGERMGTLDAVLDFTGTTDYAAALAATSQNIVATFTDTATTIGTASNPIFQITTGNVAWTDHELDLTQKTPLLKVSDKTLLVNTTDGTALWVSLTSTVAY